MRDNLYKYLKFIRFKDIGNWSVRHLLGMNIGFNKEYQMTPIGNLIKRNVKSIDIKDDTIYKQITLKTNGGGAILRDEKVGKQIGTKKQFVVSAGQFIMSKIDARNGAFGVIDSSLDGAIVTADFPVFDVVKDKIIPQYLALLSSTKPFIQFAQSCSRGTTNRQRIDVGLFLSKKIPLPTIKQQQTLVDSYNDKLFKATKLDLNITKEEKDIEDYLLSELGIQPQGYQITESELPMASEPQVEYVINRKQNTDLADTYIWGDEIKKEYKYLKFVRFKDITEWGYDRLNGYNGKLLHSTIYPNMTLASLLEINPKTEFSELQVNDDISFIPMECISDEYGEWKEKRTCKIASSKGYTKFKDGDLIWARITPCMQNGKSAVVNEMKNGYGCGSTEFHVLRNHNANLNIHYVHSLLRLPMVLNDARKSFTGSAGQQRVPKSYLEKLIIPMPSMNIQNSIVEHINKQKLQIKELRQQAETLRKEALEEFEKEIFE